MLTKHYKNQTETVPHVPTYTQRIRSNKRSCFGFLNVFVATQLQKGLFTCILFVKTICTCVFVCMRACVREYVFWRERMDKIYYQCKNNALNSLAQTSKHLDGIVCVPSCLFDALPFRPIRNASLHMRKFLFLFYVCYNTTNSLIIEGNDENNTKATIYNAWKYQEGSENAHKIVKKTQEERTRIKKKHTNRY